MNIGLSVSRVGSAAQTQALKKASAGLRLTLAQYKEIEVFNQFSSELDEATARRLRHGKNLLTLLRQEQSEPLAQYEQIILLIAGMSNVFDRVETDKISKLKSGIIGYVKETLPEICEAIEKSGKISESDSKAISFAAHEYIEKSASNG